MPLSSPPQASPGNHFWILRTGNGSGSSGTKVRRFSTIEATSWIGDGSDAIVYADSSVWGAVLTAARPGMYEIAYTDGSASVSSCSFGIALNEVNTTTSIVAIPAARRLAMTQPNGFAIHTVTRVVRLNVGDYVLAYHDGNCDLATSAVMFSIRRVGIV